MNATNASLPNATSNAAPLLVVEGLDVFYGRAHAVQGIGFSLGQGVLGIVGRNGMGKTSLCNAITGLVPAQGSVRFDGENILGLSPDKIALRGIAYVPQGRRMWPSLTVDETLNLVGRSPREIRDMYDMFPRLAERKRNGSAQLSGGEQQMLAIARALLLRPRLLIMDEPTEGLAPVIVDHVTNIMKSLVADKGLSILLIEQNLSVALEVSGQMGVMVNGRLAHEMPASVLAADRSLQERLLGLRSADSAEAPA